MRKSFITIIAVLIIITFNQPILADFKTGDRGSRIRNIQQFLYEMGYDIAVDGVYGLQTKNIVEDFQTDNGLSVDGIVGDQTYNLLKARIKENTYQIKEGDTLSEIALRFESTVEIIRERNGLKSDKILAGEKIIIPITGIGGGRDDRLDSLIYHKVRPGDSLSELAVRYGTSVQIIKQANNLKGDKILIGQTVNIPHLSKGIKGPFRLRKGVFIWPVIGRISSSYGYRINPIKDRRQFHQGIDIAVPAGTEIRAAASGKVVQSGWLSGFGKTIVLDHGNDVRTLYGHNSRLLVNSGDRVKIGDIIALAGSTGESTGPHLDFRIYLDGKTVNPVDYLP